MMEDTYQIQESGEQEQYPVYDDYYDHDTSGLLEED